MEIITANSLGDGRVVFQTARGWSHDIAKARVLEARRPRRGGARPRQCRRGGEPRRRALRDRREARGGRASCRCGCASASAPTGRPPATPSPSTPPATRRPEDTRHVSLRRIRSRLRPASGSRSSATRSARRLSGELDEEQFKPLRLQNGVYLQLHAYMLRIAVPYGTLNPRQVRQLAYIARNYDKGYGHFTTRQNLQFNWPRLEDVPDILAEARRGRDALHPDLRQLHPQRHRRPFRRRLGRRGRRPAPLCGDSAAMVVAAPGIPVPAAQIQDRGDGRAGRPRGDPVPRHRLRGEAQRRGRARLRRLYRRRHGPHAHARQEDPRLPAGGGPARLFRGDPARLQHARTARQQIQGAHQDPRPRDRHGDDRRGDRGRVRGEPPRRAAPARGGSPPHRRLFRAAGLCRAARPRAPRWSGRASPIRPSTAGCATMSAATACRATRSSRSR